MRRWLGLVLCVGLLVAPLVAPQIAHTLDEACTLATDPRHCGKEIAADGTSSEVDFGFTTTEFCVRNAAGSTDTIYVTWERAKAATVAGDGNTVIAVGDHICFGETFRTRYINVISGGSSTVYVDAWRES